MYTSNYARHGTTPSAIAISRKAPDYYTGKTFVELAPSWDILTKYRSGDITEDQYSAMYIKEIESRNVDPSLIIQLPKDTIFLCYETPKDFCHRRVFAEWIQKRTGVIIHEWQNETEQKAEEQDRLVDDLFDL